MNPLKHKLSRSKFFIWNVIMVPLYFIIFVLAWYDSSSTGVQSISFWTFFVVFTVLSALIGYRRIQDIGLHGAAAILCTAAVFFVPAGWLVLLVLPSNSFGPKPNTYTQPPGAPMPYSSSSPLNGPAGSPTSYPSSPQPSAQPQYAPPSSPLNPPADNLPPPANTSSPIQ